jgi:large subunit ribosomal protein L20
MARVKTTVVTHRRKKAVLKRAKGQFGHRSKRYQQARRSLIKSMVYSYRDRKVKKQEFRRLWIIRLNAACRENGITYSRFIKGIQDAKINLDRKMLADIAVNSPETFKKLVSVASQGGK